MPFSSILRLLCLAGAVLSSCPDEAFGQGAPRYREWTNRTGQAAVEAEYVRTSQGKVYLRLRNGRESAVDITRLSDADQQYIAARQRERPESMPAAPIEPSDEEPKSYAEVDRLTKRMRSADQVVKLLEWAAKELDTAEDKAAASAAIAMWQDRASQGLLRNGADWITPQEIDVRSAEEVRLLKEAHRLIDVKNDRLALDRFNEASRVNPEGVRADFYLGLLNALVAKEPTHAVRYFDECVDRLEASPDLLLGARRANLVAALNNLAIAEVRTMKFDRAIRHWAEAIELSPQTPELMQNLGLLTQMGGTGAGSFFSNRVGDKAGELYAKATVANGSREFDAGIGWLYIPYIDDIDGTLDDGGDNELLTVGWSTGIAVAPELILIPARALCGADRFRVTYDSAKVGSVVATDPDSDLALVRFENLNAIPMRWSDQEPAPATPMTLQGFSQPGYGAVGLRALPTTIQDSRSYAPYDLQYVAYKTAKTSDGGAAVIAYRSTRVGGGRLYHHSFVGDPGLVGGAICDARGFGYAVHLGAKSRLSRSGAKSSLAAPSGAVAAFVGRSVEPGLDDSERPSASDTAVDLSGDGPELSRTIFQVAALKFAPRLQWSHRIAAQHAAGDEGWASYEDRSCMACNGKGAGECPNRDCKRGRVTKYRTVAIQGEGAFEGRTFTKEVPYKERCSTCSGRGVVRCAGCGGDGAR